MSGYVTVFAIAGATGLLIGLVVTVLNNKPLMQLRRARRELQKIVRRSFPTTRVFTFGGVYVHPDIWIATTTDVERDTLQQDTNLIRQFRAVLLHVGYPAADVPLVQFVFESQEAVDKGFDGSWSQRRYVWHRDRF